MKTNRNSENVPGKIIRRTDTEIYGIGKIEYTLYLRTLSAADISPGPISSYSAAVVLQSEVTTERVFIPDIAAGASAAEYIFDKISTGKTTPCTAAEVIEDIIESMPSNIFSSGD